MNEVGYKYYLKNTTADFITVKASELKIKYGVSLTDANRIKGPHPLLASNGISDYVSLHNAENVICFGCRGTLGNVFYQSGKCFILNTAFYINNPTNYGPIYFALLHEHGLNIYQSGAAQPQITMDAIKDAIIKLPKSNKLNKVLDCISTYKKQISCLTKIKSLLLSKYF